MQNNFIDAIKGKTADELTRNFSRWSSDNPTAKIIDTFHYVEVSPSKTGILNAGQGQAVDHTIVLMIIFSLPQPL